MSSLKYLKDLTHKLCQRQNKLKDYSKEIDDVLGLLEQGSHDLVKERLIQMSKKMCEENLKIQSSIEDKKNG